MRNFSKILLIAVIIFVGVGTTCKKLNNLPPEPIVEFIQIETFPPDSAILTFSFGDGDGNIGLAESDTTGPFAYQNGNNPFYYNLFIEYYRKNMNQWELQELILPLYYRIQPIATGNQNTILEGEIDLKLSPYPTTDFVGPDTIKYTIQIADRELNLSNISETPELIYP